VNRKLVNRKLVNRKLVNRKLVNRKLVNRKLVIKLQMQQKNYLPKQEKNLLKLWEILGSMKVRTNLFISCYPVNKALYLFPPGFHTLAELREGYRRSIEREQMLLRSRTRLRKAVQSMAERAILEGNFLREPPREAGRRSQDDEN
jgi:hypothetical protein